MLWNYVVNIWFILNLNDLMNPVCIKLAVYHENNMTAAKKILNNLKFHLRSVTWSWFVNCDSVSIILFFKTQMNVFFKHLVRTNETGYFDKISNYFDNVKINDCDMLYLHDFFWFHANLCLPQLLDNIKENKKKENKKYKK